MTGPDRVRYLEEVRDLYLALRGGGLCLSPLDVDLVDGWWAEGVPLPLALDAVRDAAAKHRGSGRAAARRPFPLRLASSLVDERFGAYVRRSGAVARRDRAPAEDAGSGAPTGAPAFASAPAPARLSLDRLGAALAARAAAAPPPAAEAYRAAASALEAARAAGAPVDRALAAADDAQAFAYLQALPRTGQRRVAREAALGAGPRGRVPPGVHRATLRVLLGVAARLDGGLDRPSDLP